MCVRERVQQWYSACQVCTPTTSAPHKVWFCCISLRPHTHLRYPSKYHFLIIIYNIGLNMLFGHGVVGPLCFCNLYCPVWQSAVEFLTHWSPDGSSARRRESASGQHFVHWSPDAGADKSTASVCVLNVGGIIYTWTWLRSYKSLHRLGCGATPECQMERSFEVR